MNNHKIIPCSYCLKKFKVTNPKSYLNFWCSESCKYAWNNLSDDERAQKFLLKMNAEKSIFNN